MAPCLPARPDGALGWGRPGCGLPGHGDREREARALARPPALGADAAAVRLDESLADREAEPGAPGRAGALAEQVRQPVRRDPPALVRDRDRDMAVLARRFEADRRGGRSVTGRVRQQVVQHLHDAFAVGHRPRQVRRQVDHDGMAASAAHERVACPVHQGRHVRGLGLDGERARLDAAGVQQVRDQAPHVVGLPADDAEELHHLGLGRERGGVEHGRGRALDRGERGAQFMTHHAEELRALPLQLLERLQVLHGDDDRHDAVRPANGSA